MGKTEWGGGIGIVGKASASQRVAGDKKMTGELRREESMGGARSSSQGKRLSGKCAPPVWQKCRGLETEQNARPECRKLGQRCKVSEWRCPCCT